MKLTITTKSGTIVALDIPESEEPTLNVENWKQDFQISRETIVAEKSVEEVISKEENPKKFSYDTEVDTSLDAFQFPCENGSMYCPPMPLVRDFILAFGEKRVRREFLKARSWLTANTDKRKTQRGMGRFLNAWLCREAGMKRTPLKTVAPKTDSLLANGNETSEGW